MKITIATLISAVSLMAAGSSLAAETPELAQKNNCTACHAIGKKVIGPSFADIAKKYKNNPNVKPMLVSKIMNGGGGAWGAVPMPPFPKLSSVDATTLVDFVLNEGDLYLAKK